MESFYTQVSRYGNNLLYRGFNYNGKRVQKRVHFNPTLYVPSDKKQTDWTSLDGKAVEPIRFDSMREAKDFLEKSTTSASSPSVPPKNSAFVISVSVLDETLASIPPPV